MPRNRTQFTQAVAVLLAVAAGALTCFSADSTSQPQTSEAPMFTAVSTHVVREESRTYITGLEKVEWGNASPYQSSMIAVLTLAQQAGGDAADYVNLMGASGLAFRLQVYQPDGCPSSPHACCGFDCWTQALWACGRKLESFDTGGADPATIDKARAAIVASIDRGWPVIYASEEAGLVTGYIDGGKQLLVRPYSPKAEGYVTTDKWPWGITVLSPDESAPPAKDVAVNALRLAVHLWETPNFEAYASGQAAYDAWARQLDDDKRFEGKDAKALRGACQANAFTYGSLNQARGFAATYLRSIQDQFDVEAQGHIAKAAELFDQSVRANDALGHCPWSLFPRNLKGGAEWTADLRHKQAAVLREMAKLDGQAVQQIKLALEAEGVDVALPAMVGKAGQ